MPSSPPPAPDGGLGPVAPPRAPTTLTVRPGGLPHDIVDELGAYASSPESPSLPPLDPYVARDEYRTLLLRLEAIEMSIVSDRDGAARGFSQVKLQIQNNLTRIEERISGAVNATTALNSALLPQIDDTAKQVHAIKHDLRNVQQFNLALVDTLATNNSALAEQLRGKKPRPSPARIAFGVVVAIGLAVLPHADWIIVHLAAWSGGNK